MTLPFELSPSPQYSNLKKALQIEGFVTYDTRKTPIVDTEQFHQKLIDFYGEDVSFRYLKTFSKGIINHLLKWEIISPERYALISTFAGLSIEELLGPEIQKASPVANRLSEHQSVNLFMPKNEIVQYMKTKKSQIPLFRVNNSMLPEELIIIFFTPQDKELIITAASNKNTSVSTFARTILLQEARKILEEQNEEEAK